ncbi:MAG: hypothetical protein LBQ12_03735 [Deltaproteobacteria bacterium]|nr:hypothetical protein [Deltaproteobacteria bacterium]
MTTFEPAAGPTSVPAALPAVIPAQTDRIPAARSASAPATLAEDISNLTADIKVAALADIHDEASREFSGPGGLPGPGAGHDRAGADRRHRESRLWDRRLHRPDSRPPSPRG